jgi:hypothetical protein
MVKERSMTEELRKIVDDCCDNLWELGYKAGYTACEKKYCDMIERITAGDPRKEKKDAEHTGV